MHETTVHLGRALDIPLSPISNFDIGDINAWSAGRRRNGMREEFSNHHGGGANGKRPAGGGRRARLGMLSIGMGRSAGGGCVIPTDPGDGMDDGAKFRDLVWVPDDEKVDTREQGSVHTCITLHRPLRRHALATLVRRGLRVLLLLSPVVMPAQKRLCGWHLAVWENPSRYSRQASLLAAPRTTRPQVESKHICVGAFSSKREDHLREEFLSIQR